MDTPEYCSTHLRSRLMGECEECNPAFFARLRNPKARLGEMKKMLDDMRKIVDEMSRKIQKEMK